MNDIATECTVTEGFEACMVHCDMSHASSVEACIQSILHKPHPECLYTAVFCCGCRGIHRLTMIEIPSGKRECCLQPMSTLILPPHRAFLQGLSQARGTARRGRRVVSRCLTNRDPTFQVLSAQFSEKFPVRRPQQQLVASSRYTKRRQAFFPAPLLLINE